MVLRVFRLCIQSVWNELRKHGEILDSIEHSSWTENIESDDILRPSSWVWEVLLVLEPS